MTATKYTSDVQRTLRNFMRLFYYLGVLTSLIGHSFFIVAPSNYSTCLGSVASFHCVINVTATLTWTINGQYVTVYNINNPNVYPLSPAGAKSTLLMTGYYELDGIAIVCSYKPPQSAPVYSMSAFLTVQGPNVNLSSSYLNATFLKLSWAYLKQKSLQSEVSNKVYIGSENGSVYNVTVQESEVIIAIPDLCIQYTATIVPQCMSTTEVNFSVQALIGEPPQWLTEEQIALTFLPFSKEVNVSISILQPGVCYYTVVANSETSILPFSPIKAKKGWSTIVALLPQNEHFTLTVTASNIYGGKNNTYTISTFDVLDVYINSSSGDIQCRFNNGSHALGCLLVLTNAANSTEKYMVKIRKFASFPLDIILCQNHSFNGALSRKSYSVEVFDIESDGNASALPAVVKNMTFCNLCVDSPFFSNQTMSSSFTLSSTPATTKFQEPTKNFNTAALTATAVCLITLTVIASIIAIQRMLQSKLQVKKKSLLPLRSQTTAIALDTCYAYQADNSDEQPTQLCSSDLEEYRITFSDILISFSCLNIEPRLIGEGAFGVVFGATLIRQNYDHEVVAVKTIKDLNSKIEIKSFFEECERMKSFKHPNVVELLAMCLDSPDGTPLMILPYMANGNLKTFLQNCSCKETSITMEAFPKGISAHVLTEMCLDIAKGMKYLADKRFVHRDLAARNCMVDLNLSIKVGDFGLTRDMHHRNYYRKSRSQKCPIKWMPPEMLRYGVSTEKSDIWSYGVTCWEVFSLGSLPYPGVENYEMLEYLCKGLRLKQPRLCPDSFFVLMQTCWDNEPNLRPCFQEVLQTVENIATK